MSADGRYLLASAGSHIVLANATSRLVLASTQTTSESKPGALVRDVAVFSVNGGAAVRIAGVSDDKRMYAYEWTTTAAKHDGSSGSLRFVGSRQFKKRPITCAFAGGPDAVAVADRHGDAFLCDWSSLRPDVTRCLSKTSLPPILALSAQSRLLLPLPAGARRLAAANRDEQVFIRPSARGVRDHCRLLSRPRGLCHFARIHHAGCGAAAHCAALGRRRRVGACLERHHGRSVGRAANPTQPYAPLATITGVEPMLAPELVIRSLAAFDNDVYYVTQNGAVYHILKLAAGVGGALTLLRWSAEAARRPPTPRAPSPWRRACGSPTTTAPLCCMRLPMVRSARLNRRRRDSGRVERRGAAAILKEIDPSLFQHQFDSNTRGRGGGRWRWCWQRRTR
jgi:hypothetical protein